MKLSLNLTDFSYPPGTLAQRLTKVVEAADEAGIDTVWVGDHLIMVAPGGSIDDPMLEAYTTLGYLAARTRQVRLGWRSSPGTAKPSAAPTTPSRRRSAPASRIPPTPSRTSWTTSTTWASTTRSSSPRAPGPPTASPPSPCSPSPDLPTLVLGSLGSVTRMPRLDGVVTAGQRHRLAASAARGPSAGVRRADGGAACRTEQITRTGR
ncbi:LLM class flavin-dependent oxidoreductase [Nonomuraea sediminis]|uniref:LLM class flavin-dependent oxidoreductase n=1 Tax=Nonomuraea sediminis TaxID=2835864 RepID=UPI001BDD9EA4|nr:LLM class flavin-dependent oxidoreductase [Nonomuraea sediminis]